MAVSDSIVSLAFLLCTLWLIEMTWFRWDTLAPSRIAHIKMLKQRISLLQQSVICYSLHTASSLQICLFCVQPEPMPGMLFRRCTPISWYVLLRQLACEDSTMLLLLPSESLFLLLHMFLHYDRSIPATINASPFQWPFDATPYSVCNMLAASSGLPCTSCETLSP